ncbi:hypothetical protein D1872_310060 [compost metagenome]
MVDQILQYTINQLHLIHTGPGLLHGSNLMGLNPVHNNLDRLVIATCDVDDVDNGAHYRCNRNDHPQVGDH